jgi:hypothetical protein
VEGLIEVGEDDVVVNSEPESALTTAAAPAAEPAAPVAAVGATAVAGEVPSSAVAAGVVAIAPSVAVPAPIAVVRPPRPCRIDFEGCPGTEAAKVEVRAWIDRLGELMDPMTSAEVAIEAVHEPRKDRMFRVRMRLAMRAGVVVVPPDHPNNGAHEDIFCAIRNAFRAARRQLEGYLKEHPPVAPAVAVDAPIVSSETAVAPAASEAPGTGDQPV